MPTRIDTGDDDVVTVDTYCPSCGADAIPLLGRDCDCDLREDVVCSLVVERSTRDEPLRATITDREGWLDAGPLVDLFEA